MFFEAIVSTAWSLRQVCCFDIDLDAITRLLVTIRDGIECLIAQVNMAATFGASVGVTTVTVVFASVARIVHRTSIGHFHNDASAL